MGIISRTRATLKRLRDYNPDLDYLEQSTSAIDLELRMRELDRRKATRPSWRL